jgi:molecular chaperone HscB
VSSPDYFSFLGLDRRLTLDPAVLQTRYYELSRQWHPDRFARRPASEQAEALENTARLNDALRALRDPVSRAEYVLSSEGFSIAEQRSGNVPPELLEEVFDLNMALDELRSGDDSVRGKIEALGVQFRQMIGTIDTDLAALFAAWDSGARRETLERIRGVLNRRKYIHNLVRSVDQALSR